MFCALTLNPGPVFAMGNVGDRPGRNLCEGAQAPSKKKKKLKPKLASFLDYRSFPCQVSGVGGGAPHCHVNLLLRVIQVVCVRRGKGEGEGGEGDKFATAEVGKGEGREG